MSQYQDNQWNEGEYTELNTNFGASYEGSGNNYSGGKNYGESPSPKPKSNVTLIVVCVIIGLIVLAGIGYLVYVNFLDKSSEDMELVIDQEEGYDSEYEHQYDWLSERAVTAYDLEGRTAGDLRLLKNAIYARHGYIFKSADLAEYFSRFSWYTPKYHDVNQFISPLEQKNIAYITKYKGATSTSSATPAPKPKSSNLQHVTYAYDYSDIVCNQKLTRADLTGLSKAELRILRNTIYARHGRKFKSADLKNYFNSFPWYNGVYDEVSPNSLSEIERHNLSVIQGME